MKISYLSTVGFIDMSIIIFYKSTFRAMIRVCLLSATYILTTIPIVLGQTWGGLYNMDGMLSFA